jgi:hypothetical protein
MNRSIIFVSAIITTILATTGCALDSSDPTSATTPAAGEEAITGSSLSAATIAKANKILSQKIKAYYEADGQTFGVVSEHGSAKLSATSDPKVVNATGEFEDNELWGGAFLYRYDVNVDLSTGLIKQIKKPEMTKEIN